MSNLEIRNKLKIQRTEIQNRDRGKLVTGTLTQMLFCFGLRYSIFEFVLLSWSGSHRGPDQERRTARLKFALEAGRCVASDAFSASLLRISEANRCWRERHDVGWGQRPTGQPPEPEASGACRRGRQEQEHRHRSRS
jgi:hypothetical protein